MVDLVASRAFVSPRTCPANCCGCRQSGGRHAGIGKFALYSKRGPCASRDLDPDTVDLLGADSSEADLMRLGDLALSGQMVALLEALGRLPHGGSEAVPVLRALQRRLLMLAPLRARVERGERVDAVMTSMGKTLFWKDKTLLRGSCRLARGAAGGSRFARCGARTAHHVAALGGRSGAGRDAGGPGESRQPLT